MCFKDACQPHWNVIIRALVVFLSCSLTVFKLVSERKIGRQFPHCLGGRLCKPPCIFSCCRLVSHDFSGFVTSPKEARSWCFSLLGSSGSTRLASQPSFLSFPSSIPSSLIIAYLVNAAMAVHSNSLHSQVQTQLAVAEPASLL